MRYDENARLDTSEVSDSRGGGMLSGGSGMAIGGGGLGVVGVLIYLVVSLVGGGNASAVSDVLGQLGQGGTAGTADNTEVSKECRTGADANTRLDCAVVADIDSIQSYWTGELPRLGLRYTEVPTVWFTGQVSTGCGAASSGTGPFYCPADKQVYIDLTFYNDLHTQFGAQGGLFVDAYVLAHEYGHHVQDLLGTSSQVRAGATGPASGSVRLELQADCYAGVWANHATTTPGPDGRPLVTDITADDVRRALDTAGRIGDDYIQTHLGGGSVNRSTFTHGSSAQRRKWFSTGYRTGNPKACDTFSTADLG
ncbi:MAG: KPN_02809 family neutral zinc metallopeptidase [Jatrophihabitantaceae bacterium]